MSCATAPQPDGAAAIARAVRSREASAVEIIERSLERACTQTRELGSFSEILHTRARERARAVDRDLRRGLDPGPLAGVPVSVKDAIWLEGVRATNGSFAWRDFVPAESSASAARVEQAGAIVIGKTNNPEFCFFGYTDGPLLGPARNPVDRELTAGGSSGGAAASVAGGVTPVALGSDGGGSIRGPASFCGVVGLKPTFGLVPSQPGFQTWPSLSVDGPIARSTADAAAALSALAGIDPRDDRTVDAVRRDYMRATDRPAELLRGCRIAWSDDLGYAAVDPQVRALFYETIARLEGTGASLEMAHPEAEDPTSLWTEIAVCEGFAALGHLLPEWEARMWPGVADIIRAGDRSAATYLRAMARRSRFSRAWSEFFECHEILLTPMMQVPPFPVGVTGPTEIDGRPVDPFFDDWSNLCYAASLTGQPAASVPIGSTEGGLPAGLQVIGPRFRDDLVLAIGTVVQELDVAAHANPQRPTHLNGGEGDV